MEWEIDILVVQLTNQKQLHGATMPISLRNAPSTLLGLHCEELMALLNSKWVQTGTRMVYLRKCKITKKLQICV